MVDSVAPRPELGAGVRQVRMEAVATHFCLPPQCVSGPGSRTRPDSARSSFRMYSFYRFPVMESDHTCRHDGFVGSTNSMSTGHSPNIVITAGSGLSVGTPSEW